jgi:hypothetical protein
MDNDQTQSNDEWVLQGGAFTIVPEPLIHSKSLTDGAIRLYLHLKWVAGQGKTNWQARAKIAKQLGISEATVDNRLGELMCNDWIVGHRRIDADGNRHSNLYYIFEIQEAAISWRVQHDSDQNLIQKPKPRELKSRKGVGGKPSHKPKETQVSVGTPSQAGTDTQRKLEYDTQANSSTRELDQVSIPELDQVPNTLTDNLSLAPAAQASKKNIQVGRVQEKDSEEDCYIGRRFNGREASPWQNLYVMDKPGKKAAGTRLEVNAKYLHTLLQNDVMLACLPELLGKHLRCYCDPDLCHGHSLKLLAEMDEVTLQRWRRAARDQDDPLKLLEAFMEEVRDGGIKAAYLKALGDHQQVQANAAREFAKISAALNQKSHVRKQLYSLTSDHVTIHYVLLGGEQTACMISALDPSIVETPQPSWDMSKAKVCGHCSLVGKSGSKVELVDDVPLVEQTPIDEKIETPPTQISVGGWYPAGKVSANGDLIKRSGYLVVDLLYKVVYFHRFKTKREAESSDLFKSCTMPASWSAWDIQQGWGGFTLLKPATDLGILPEEKSVIDAYYDGIPEARRPAGAYLQRQESRERQDYHRQRLHRGPGPGCRRVAIQGLVD